MRGAVLIPPVRDGCRSLARAAVLSSGGGVIGYQTAARLHGLQGLPRELEEPHVILGAHRTRAQRPGLRQHFRRLDPADVTDCGGIPVTSVPRTLTDLALRLERRTMVALADSGLHQGVIVPTDVPVAVRGLVDGRAESPSESVARLVCVDAGIGPEALQWRVYDGAEFVARLDIAWPEKKVALEVDSRHHDEPAALYRDRERQNRLMNLGWTVLRVTWYDLTTNPVRVLVSLFRALGVSGTIKISR
jgi:hypothetical protein